MADTRECRSGALDLVKAGDNQELQQGGRAAGAPVATPDTDMLASTAGAVQGMMAAMGAPMPTPGAATLMQGTVVNPDGTATTNIATNQPSNSAHTSTSYNPVSNMVTTTTVDPATGSMTTTSTTAPPGMAEAASRDSQQLQDA